MTYPEIMTPEEAAEYLRRPKGTLKVWRCRGIGPSYIKQEGRIRYRRRDLDAYNEAQTYVTRAGNMGGI